MNKLIAYAPYLPNTLVLIIVLIVLIALIPRWPYSVNWGYNPLVTLIVILLLVWLLMGLSGCSGGVHGNVNTSATVNPNDPKDVKVVVGGQLNFAKKPKHFTHDSK
jgi:MFS superfamily sulfate permease-like transporter